MEQQSDLRVLFISAEADPLVKVGGLGDVTGSLPPALKNLRNVLPDFPNDQTSVDIRLVIPFHGTIKRDEFSMKRVISLQVDHKNGPISAEAYELNLQTVPIYLIEGEPFPLQAPVYSMDIGFDSFKFIFFSLAALELCRLLNWQPHIVHANDWHTAPSIYWLALHRKEDPFFQRTATLLSVHNLPFLGVGAGFYMDSFFLPPAGEGPLPDWARHLPLPLGLLTADHIVTVSPTYAREILTPEFSSGLDEFLKTKASTITGILNGIDFNRWNPSNDPNLSKPYSQTSLSLRKDNKMALLNDLGFTTGAQDNKTDQLPLIAIVSRMDYQKGIDLAIQSLSHLANQGSTTGRGFKAVILGTGLPEIEEVAQQLEMRFPDRVKIVTRFDEPLSHRIYAGADMLLMPSRYEPCGLSQMIAMRYGCVPIVRATGGLADTVLDFSTTEQSTGFVFQESTSEALNLAIERAMKVYFNPEAWQALQRRGMTQDYSWNRSALEYLRIYKSLIKSTST